MIDPVAREALSILGTGQQVTPFSFRYPGFSLADAYEVVGVLCDMRRACGENPIGRKIGFTNRTVWSGYGISGPIWNYMFDTTVHELAAVGQAFALKRLPEPRVEREIVLHLASAPQAGMSEDQLCGCIDWIAHGFEVVQSVFPGWTFAAVDAAAAYGMHGALLLGDRQSISGQSSQWQGAALKLSHGARARRWPHAVRPCTECVGWTPEGLGLSCRRTGSLSDEQTAQCWRDRHDRHIDRGDAYHGRADLEHRPCRD